MKKLNFEELTAPEAATRILAGVQIVIGPRLQPDPNRPVKPNAAERRAAKIKAGKLKLKDGKFQ